MSLERFLEYWQTHEVGVLNEQPLNPIELRILKIYAQWETEQLRNIMRQAFNDAAPELNKLFKERK